METLESTVYVNTMKELKNAIKEKSEKIVVRGTLATRLKPLAKIKKANVFEGMSKRNLIAANKGSVTAAVWITLIITTGVVVIVSLLMGYNATVKGSIKDKNLEVIFTKK